MVGGAAQTGGAKGGRVDVRVLGPTQHSCHGVLAPEHVKFGRRVAIKVHADAFGIELYSGVNFNPLSRSDVIGATGPHEQVTTYEVCTAGAN